MLYDNAKKRSDGLRDAIYYDRGFAEAAPERIYCGHLPNGYAMMCWTREPGVYNYYSLRCDGIRGPNFKTVAEARNFVHSTVMEI